MIYDNPQNLPKSIFSGNMRTPHVQGIALDKEEKYIYFSFTTCLLKCDMNGNPVGSCVGLTGHLGCIAYNPDDGRVYGSLEYKSKNAFYAAIFDVKKITRMNMNAESDGVMTTVYLSDVVNDFMADMDNNGVFDGDTADTLDHRYGCSGIDGTTFGKIPGAKDNKKYLMIAYGIYSNLNRNDNDCQVIVSYDIKDWKKYESPLVQDKPHKNGPQSVSGKYFVYTGNTNYGVQNLEYDDSNGNYYMAVYNGYKPTYPNYDMYIIDGKVAPQLKEIPGGNGEKAMFLSLLESGLKDEKTGVYGLNKFPGTTGLICLGNGYFYISEEGGFEEKGEWINNSTVRLYVRCDDDAHPVKHA